ncbi:hypothetical protein Nisw_05925 [Candidatus Nitrosopumilus sp. SW]|uniref:hypothetical protein n=1 Tax=Candidatus Nitrosopumilus sp. SW TaxID=2508726 RepID=UPI00114E2F69|nr:hypothetical protein [Candidatus Nitrosopumilus sp. SW]QDI89095.1 hypothetical protein Nisw_05925 [Candidatus Nitrosopumilus sp. SW]
MSIEKTIEDCKIYLNQIKQYEPDPFYVNHYFSEFIDSVNRVLEGIFDEANRDFGLFIAEKISCEKFLEKAKSKNDLQAIKFSEWYLDKFNQEHKSRFPKAIKKICELKNKQNKLPKIKIMIRALDRYENDINQQIMVGLSNEKLRSKEELQIEINRQLPVFLEVINYKRSKNNEPSVNENQITTSAFIDIEDIFEIEIAYASEIYIPVLIRMVEESRKKIKELTSWS